MNPSSAITKPESRTRDPRLPSFACKTNLRACLAFCMALAMACVLRADTAVPAFKDAETPLTIGGVDYTWQSPAVEEPDVNDGSIILHTDTYVNGEQTITLTGRLGDPQPILAIVSGAANGIWYQNEFFAGGYIARSPSDPLSSMAGYNWVSGGNYMEVKPDWSLGFKYGEHTYAAMSTITTTVDADGNGTFTGTNGETGVVFGGNLYFDHPSVASSTYGVSSYSLFGATYSFNSGSLIYSISHSTQGASMLSATEWYQTLDGQGTLYVFYQDVLAGEGVPISGVFSGHDPAVGMFSGTFPTPAELAFDAGRPSPSFAAATLWVNSTAVTFSEGRILNSNGDVRDTYTGTDLDDNIVTLTITGNVLSNGTASVQVRVGPLNQPPVAEGSGTLANTPLFFSVSGWYVGEAESNRSVPHFAPGALRLFVNGSIYSFHAGIDGGCGSIDVYENASLGRITLVGPSAGTSATVDVTYAGTKWKGTYGVDEPDAFSVNGCTITSWANPEAFWVGSTFYARSPVNLDVYVSGDYSLTVTMGDGAFHVSGTDASCTFEGNFPATRGGFICHGDNVGTVVRLLACPSNADGSLQIGSFVLPEGIPPAISIGSEIWPCVGITLDTPGSAAPSAHYANVASALTRSLSILPDGNVIYTDNVGGFTVTGHYSTTTHLFQSDYGQLPMPIYGADPQRNYARWHWLTPPSWRPNTVLVAGEVWGYTGKDATGADIYRGYYTDQKISFAGDGRDGYSHITLTDPLHPTAGEVSTFAGTFYNNRFTMDATASGLTVASGDGTGTGIAGGLSFSTTGADLDVLGNLFSLGSLIGKPNVVGLSLEFADVDNTAKLYSTLGRPQAEWFWNRADASPTPIAIPMMKLDSGNRLTLFDPQDATKAAILLDPDPAVGSRINGPLRVAPGGDLSMGPYTNGPKPDGSN